MTWAAMDVHARSTYAASMDVATGELSRQRFDTGAVELVVAWLAGLPGPVRCCYEAGPTGFGLYRAAVAAGIDCQVIAPSKTPRPSGDRNKSDRRDTDLLLRQLMAGALTPVAVPSATFEAARDLARAREQIRIEWGIHLRPVARVRCGGADSGQRLSGLLRGVRGLVSRRARV